MCVICTMADINEIHLLLPNLSKCEGADSFSVPELNKKTLVSGAINTFPLTSVIFSPNSISGQLFVFYNVSKSSMLYQPNFCIKYLFCSYT